MAQALTPGRWRGLKAASTEYHVFSILAFDQRGSYRKMLPSGITYGEAVDIKQEVVVHLTRSASAVLLDSHYGLPAAMAMRGGAGLLMSVEESGYSGDSTYRKLLFNDGWDVSKIKRMGASAVKLLAYYHPHSGALAEEIEGVIAGVLADCHKHDLPLFVEPMSYSLDATIAKESAAFAAARPEVVRDTARRLGALGPDVLKLEFPVDAAFNGDRRAWRAACDAVSEVSAVPWVLLSAGVDFETFAEQTRIACQAGASGWLAGRAIWKEAVVMSAAERSHFLSGTATQRILELNAIANAAARPWTDFYTQPVSGEDWYQYYSG
jgi:tagatose-1,6-bisphosphate aldolase